MLEIDGAPKEAKKWILDDIGSDKSNLISFLSTALWEELQTSRAFIQIDFPNVDLESLSPAERGGCPTCCLIARYWGVELYIVL
jgi:hypothetical protein